MTERAQDIDEGGESADEVGYANNRQLAAGLPLMHCSKQQQDAVAGKARRQAAESKRVLPLAQQHGTRSWQSL